MRFFKDAAFAKGWALVISSFIIVFAFSTVDHAISPMVAVLEAFFDVPAQQVLWLISSCTLGIVAGLFAGPQLIKSFTVKQVFAASILMMVAGLFVFVNCNIFWVSLTVRFIFGLGAGLISTIMWWLAYESIDRAFYTPMITVLTASRPMAVAAGVPLVMYASNYAGWQAAFAAAGVLLLLFSFSLAWGCPKDTGTKHSFTVKSVFMRYLTAAATPNFKPFFCAMFVNRICYFGFYSMLGLWFMKKYNLTTIEMAKPLMVIGLCETLINFIVPLMMKIGKKTLFYFAVGLSIISFAAFIWGFLPIWAAIFFIALFAMSDRIYNMLILIFIPEVFPSSKDRTTIGSSVTLVSWTALAFISYLQGAFLEKAGMDIVSLFLLFALIAGIISYIAVLRKSVLGKAG